MKMKIKKIEEDQSCFFPLVKMAGNFVLMKMKKKLEEDQSCQTFNLQFQRGIGPPPQTPLRRKMSGKKSTNRVSFRRKILSTVVTIIFSIKNRVSAKILNK